MDSGFVVVPQGVPMQMQGQGQMTMQGQVQWQPFQGGGVPCLPSGMLGAAPGAEVPDSGWVSFASFEEAAFRNA